MKRTEKVKACRGEEKYVDFDDESGMYCVFGTDSGFAYSSWASRDCAEQCLAEDKENRR